MNANELADKLQELDSKLHLIELFKLATMLRQQQNEIEDLKSANRFIQNFAEEQHKRAVALEMRELTDEEIWELHQEHIDEVTCGHSMKTVGFIEFARAILRKAQEK